MRIVVVIIIIVVGMEMFTKYDIHTKNKGDKIGRKEKSYEFDGIGIIGN